MQPYPHTALQQQSYQAVQPHQFRSKYISTYAFVCIYINIHRDRESERERYKKFSLLLSISYQVQLGSHHIVSGKFVQL